MKVSGYIVSSLEELRIGSLGGILDFGRLHVRISRQRLLFYGHMAIVYSSKRRNGVVVSRRKIVATVRSDVTG